MGAIDSLFVSLGVQADTPKIMEFQRALQSTISTALTSVMAITGVTLAFREMLEDTLSTSVALKQFNLLTGLSTQELQKWQIAGQMANVSASAVTRSVTSLQNSIAMMKYTGQGASPFMFLGITNPGNAFGVLDQLRDKLRNASAEMRPFIIAQMQQIGVSAEMVPLLMSTNQEWAEYAKQYKNAMSPDAQKKALAFQTEMNKLKLEIQSLWREIMVGLLPTLRIVFTLIKDVASIIGPIFKGIIWALDKIDAVLRRVTNGLISLKRIAEAILIVWMAFKVKAMAVGAVSGIMKLLAIPGVGEIMLVVAALSMLMLIIEDIWGYFHGKKSVLGVMVANIGPWIKKHTQAFRDTMEGVWASIKHIGTIISGVCIDAWNWANALFKHLGKLIDEFMTKFNVVLAAFQSLKTVVDAVTGNGDKDKKGKEDSSAKTIPGQAVRRWEGAIGAAPARNMAQSIGQNYQRKSEQKYDSLILEAANKYGIDVNLLKAIIKQESGFDRKSKSRTGAMGLMQLMPGTAKDLGVTDAYDPRQNIMGGSKHFAGLLKKYNGNVKLALAAYNAGEGNVKKYGGVPPFAETQDYIKQINKFYGRYSKTASSAYGTPTGMFDSISGPMRNTMSGPLDLGYDSINGMSSRVQGKSNQNQQTTYHTNIEVHANGSPEENANHIRREFNRQVERAHIQRNNQGY